MIHPDAKKVALELAVKLGREVAQVNRRAEPTKNAEVVAQLGNGSRRGAAAGQPATQPGRQAPLTGGFLI